MLSSRPCSSYSLRVLHFLQHDRAKFYICSRAAADTTFCECSILSVTAAAPSRIALYKLIDGDRFMRGRPPAELLRNRDHGQGLARGLDQDPSFAALVAGGRRALQHRLPEGRRGQPAARRLGSQPRRLCCLWTGRHRGFFRTHLPQEIGLLEIWFPDFGLCLCKAIEAQLACGHEAACVLNSDSPTLPSALSRRSCQRPRRPGRSHRARAVDRRRLLPARLQGKV